MQPDQCTQNIKLQDQNIIKSSIRAHQNKSAYQQGRIRTSMRGASEQKCQGASGCNNGGTRGPTKPSVNVGRAAQNSRELTVPTINLEGTPKWRATVENSQAGSQGLPKTLRDHRDTQPIEYTEALIFRDLQPGKEAPLSCIEEVHPPAHPTLADDLRGLQQAFTPAFNTQL